ncbi:uncharacterized protein SPSK_07950 [Sporothrix schenckii 1099-18]|uniref:Uncharacterized protein n=1 Tax=Sporothrix schenckii 1099-18 TaxID=1397361 RepID=A0A0F2MIF4_SPOSC|nr:uncharacterized protein SPSK_07950 [Sporothrix schenckii 1099-18]KJR87941.1 hypothetical protein SPSK_07950 [Sporothrix schenckii 1099-18]
MSFVVMAITTHPYAKCFDAGMALTRHLFIQNSIGAGQSNGGNLVVTDGNGFNTNLIYGIGSQFMTLPLATARWSQTLPDVLDELQYLTMYDAHSPTWTVKVNMDAFAMLSLDVELLTISTKSSISTSDAASTTSASHLASASTPATSLSSMEVEDVQIPDAATVVPGFDGDNDGGPHTGGGEMSFAILRMLAETPAEMPWPAVFIESPFDEE